MATWNKVVGEYVELHKYLEHLDRRVLYFGTDSIIFSQKDGEWMPPVGDFLGDLTDELGEYGDGRFLNEFVSGGPKIILINFGQAKTSRTRLCAR